MKRASLALVSLAVASSAIPGRAEAGNSREKEWRGYMESYASCVVAHAHARAREIVMNDPSDRDLQKKYSDIFIDKPVDAIYTCPLLNLRYQAEWLMNPDMLRFDLAQELVRSDLGQFETASFATVPALTHRDVESKDALAARLHLTAKKQANQLQLVYETAVGSVWLSHFGECVSRQDPMLVKSWLQSKSGSIEEKQAMQNLGPAFAGCVPDGRELHFNRYDLRGAVAMSYYRLSMQAINAHSAGATQ